MLRHFDLFRWRLIKNLKRRVSYRLFLGRRKNFKIAYGNVIQPPERKNSISITPSLLFILCINNRFHRLIPFVTFYASFIRIFALSRDDSYKARELRRKILIIAPRGSLRFSCVIISRSKIRK